MISSFFGPRLAVAVFFLTPALSTAQPVLETNDVLAMSGDSITQQGIYSLFVEDYLLMCQSVSGVKTIQCGWGGTSAPFMADHLKDGVLTFAPTVATTAFGMNDGEFSLATPDIEKRYREGMEHLVDAYRASGTRTVIIGSPGAVDSYYFKNPHDSSVTADLYNQTLGRLTEVAKEVATEKGMPFADLHTPMMETMTQAKAAKGEKYPVYGEMDGVHATPNGHLVMGCDGNIGTITYDAASGQTDATEGHRVVSSKVGEVTLESTRYPYCFQHGNDHPVGPTANILPFLPFNDELNRYLLVVKNLKSPKAKITWGSESKEFDATKLAKGVNLAAEFIDNPFVPAFASVDKEVTMKNDFEVLAVTFYLGQKAPALAALLPDKTASFEQTAAGLHQINDGLLAHCANAVKPVTHTIKIEEVN